MFAVRGILVVVACLLVAKVHAAEPGPIGITGDNLVELFTSEDPSRSTFAFGYVVGIAEAMNRVPRAQATSAGGAARWFCLPAYTTPMRIVEAVQKYFGQNPELRPQLAGQLVVAALVQAFPCDSSE